MISKTIHYTDADIREGVIDGSMKKVLVLGSAYYVHPDDAKAECGLTGSEICHDCEKLV